MTDIKFPVCVTCMTYNQSAYICDALNGFTMQQTTFPYVCIIMDDASTDGEQEVIKQYLSVHFKSMILSHNNEQETDDFVMTFAQHKENKNCFFAVYYLKYNHYQKKRKNPYYRHFFKESKYAASCEGDDYWTNPNKLQIQYDYLETHPKIVLSCHRWTILDIKTNQETLARNPFFDKKRHDSVETFEFDINYFLHSWITKTLTCMVRTNAIKEDFYKGFRYARDVHYFYYIMTKGHGVCHAFNGGTYRKNVSTSIFGNLTKEEQTSINSRVYEELADVTKDPKVRMKANRLIVLDCMNRLKDAGGGYYVVLKLARIINKVFSCIKHGRKEIPTIEP